MKIAKITVEAHAHYSGRTYKETLFADYEKVKDLNGEIITFYELDGKHSEVDAEIEVQLVDDNYFKNNCEPENDGEDLYWHLVESRDISEKAFMKPAFGRIKKEITCTPEQWEIISKMEGIEC